LIDLGKGEKKLTKKLFVMILGAFLVVAFAAGAYAETKVTFKGEYRARGWLIQNANVADDSNDEDKAAYIDHRWRLSGTFAPNENLVFNFRGVANENQIWGAAGTTPVAAGRTDGVMTFDRMFMQIKTSFGSFFVGLQGSKVSGLAHMGWSDRLPFDEETDAWVARWAGKFGPLGVGFVYEKAVENDYTYQPTGWAGGTPDSDQDFNHYILSAQYMFANGGVNGYLHYFHNSAVPGVSNNWWTFQPAVLLNFGPVGLRGELQWSTGEIKAGGVDRDREGLGIYLDGGYTYGPGQIGAYYLWVQGDDPTTTELEGTVGSGGDFEPLLLVYEIGLWYAAGPGLPNLAENGNNHWIFGLYWNHSVTEDLMLNAAYGYINLNEVPAGVDDSYGSEFDFGISYGVMANLTYNATFGYFMPGDAWKFGVAGAKDPNAAWALKHELVMTF